MNQSISQSNNQSTIDSLYRRLSIAEKFFIADMYVQLKEGVKLPELQQM